MVEAEKMVEATEMTETGQARKMGEANETTAMAAAACEGKAGREDEEGREEEMKMVEKTDVDNAAEASEEAMVETAVLGVQADAPAAYPTDRLKVGAKGEEDANEEMAEVADEACVVIATSAPSRQPSVDAAPFERDSLPISPQKATHFIAAQVVSQRTQHLAKRPEVAECISTSFTSGSWRSQRTVRASKLPL